MPVPIQELCAGLGIIGKKAIDIKGFECGLATTAKRFEGIILAKRGGGPSRPLPIAHELVRCLIAHYVPD